MSRRSHFARVHVGGQVADRLSVIDRRRFDGLGVDDGLADVAERLVHRVRQRVDRRRLRFARDDQARAAVRLQILRDRRRAHSFQPVGAGAAPAAVPRRLPAAIAAGVSGSSISLGRSAQSGDRPSRRSSVGIALDRVKPVHAVGVLGTPARGEIARVAQAARAAAEQIGVEREDDVGVIELILRIERTGRRRAARRGGRCSGRPDPTGATCASGSRRSRS